MNSVTLDLHPETFHSPPTSVLGFSSEHNIYDLPVPSDGEPSKQITDVSEFIEEAGDSIDNDSESSPLLLSVGADTAAAHVTIIPRPTDVDGTTKPGVASKNFTDSSQLTQLGDGSQELQYDQNTMVLQYPQQLLQQQHSLTPLSVIGSTSINGLTAESNIVLVPATQGPLASCPTIQLTEEDVQQIQKQLQQRLLGQPITAATTMPIVATSHPYVYFNAFSPSVQTPQFIVPAPAQGYTTPSAITIPALHPITTVSTPPVTTQTQYQTTLNKPTSILTKAPTPATPNKPAIQYIKLHPGIDESMVDLDELQRFAKFFKQKRVEMGFTQGDVGMALGKCYPNDFSQTTISRFEACNLSPQNMRKLKPLLQRWIDNQSHISLISSTFCSPTPPEASTSDSKRRKKRTTIEDNIKDALEVYFQSNPKPNTSELSKLAVEHNIEREVVRVWFCNRRQREKRLPKMIPMQSVQGAMFHPTTSNEVSLAKANGCNEQTINGGQKNSSATVISFNNDTESQAGLSAAMASPQGASLHNFTQPLIFHQNCN